MQSCYTLGACEDLIQRYYERGGDVVTLEEGSLGLGLTICYGEGLKTAIIKEFCISAWGSGHTIRMYNNMPKKYANMLEKVLAEPAN